MAKQIIRGQHRNLELAKRHLRELQRENPGAVVQIISRRNGSGKFSSRGQQFIFEVKRRAKKKPKKPIEEEFIEEAEEFGEEEEYGGAFDSSPSKKS